MKHATISFVAPSVSARIPKEKLGTDMDAFIYNSRETTKSEVLKELSETERLEYIDKPILEHSSTRLTKPFKNAIDERAMFKTEPISYIYESITSIASVKSLIASAKPENLCIYRLLIPSKCKCSSFIDDGNVFIIMH